MRLEDDNEAVVDLLDDRDVMVLAKRSYTPFIQSYNIHQPYLDTEQYSRVHTTWTI